MTMENVYSHHTLETPHNPGAENEKSPRDTAIGRMMQIMMCEMQNNKRQVEVNKNIRYNNKSRRR